MPRLSYTMAMTTGREHTCAFGCVSGVQRHAKQMGQLCAVEPSPGRRSRSCVTQPSTPIHHEALAMTRPSARFRHRSCFWATPSRLPTGSERVRSLRMLHDSPRTLTTHCRAPCVQVAFLHMLVIAQSPACQAVNDYNNAHPTPTDCLPYACPQRPHFHL